MLVTSFCRQNLSPPSQAPYSSFVARLVGRMHFVDSTSDLTGPTIRIHLWWDCLGGLHFVDSTAWPKFERNMFCGQLIFAKSCLHLLRTLFCWNPLWMRLANWVCGMRSLLQGWAAENPTIHDSDEFSSLQNEEPRFFSSNWVCYKIHHRIEGMASHCKMINFVQIDSSQGSK